MPPKKEKLKGLDEIPDDWSDYFDKITSKLERGAELVSGSTDATFSSGSSSSERPNFANILPGSIGSPKVRMVEEFMRNTDESGDWLQKWYSENYEKVQDYDSLRFELLYFLSDYMPGINVDENINPINLVELVKSLVLELQTKFNKFNLDLRQISGHEVAGYIKDHHRKVLEVVEDYENKLKNTTSELAMYKAQVAHLNAELSSALQRMMYLERGTKYYGGFEDSVKEEEFMEDLQNRVAHSQSLSSTLREELEWERQQNEGLFKQLAYLARMRVEDEEKSMQEIVKLSQRAEINSMLEDGIKSLLEEGSKEPNTQDCQNVIENWKKEINQVIDQNSKEIDELLKKIESQNEEIAKLQAKSNEQEEKLEKMKSQVRNKKKLRRKRPRPRPETLYSSTDEASSFLPIHGLEVIRFEDEAVGGKRPIQGDPISAPRGQLRYEDGQWIDEERSEPEAASQYEPPKGAGLMGPVRLDQAGWSAVGGRQSPIEQPQAGEALRFVDGQWIDEEGNEPEAAPQYEPFRGADLMGRVRLDQDGRPNVGGRQSPIEQAQAGGALRLVDGQWVSAGSRSPQRPSSPHSALRSPGQSRIPTRMEQDTSSMRSAGPTSRGRLEVPGMRPTTPRSGTPTRRQAPGMQLTTPRAGTAHRIGGSGMRPAAARGRTSPRAGASGIRPTATRRGTPPRPRIPTQRSTAQRGRIPRRPPAPSARTTQGQGAPGRQTPAATPANALMSRVVLLSPQRQEPLALDVDVSPQNIVTNGAEFVCEVSVGVHPAIPEAGGQGVGRGRRGRRARPHFTPKSSFR